jgi:hypothetical protein
MSASEARNLRERFPDSHGSGQNHPTTGSRISSDALTFALPHFHFTPSAEFPHAGAKTPRRPRSHRIIQLFIRRRESGLAKPLKDSKIATILG